MDINSRKKLSDLIHKATNTGSLELADEDIKGLKEILRVSNVNVKAAFDILMDKLKSKHSQIRISTVNIINELFQRSKYFRELICQMISVYMEYTLGFNISNPLPPPAQYAKILKVKSLEYIEKWYESYGEHYIILKNTYYYLKNSLKIDFPEIRNQILLRSNEDRIRRENTQQILKIKYNKLKLEFSNETNRIISIMDDLEDSIKSVIPDLNNFESLFNDNNNNNNSNNNNNNNNSNRGREMTEIVRNGGFGSSNYALNVELEEGGEEEFIKKENPIENGKLVLMSRHITEVEKFHSLILNDWHQTLVKIIINPDNDYTQYLRRVIELQNRITNLKERCKDINIVPFENLDLDQDKIQDTNNNGEGEGIDEDEFDEILVPFKNKSNTKTTSNNNSNNEENLYIPNANNISMDSINNISTNTNDSNDDDDKDGSGDKEKEVVVVGDNGGDGEESLEDLLKRAPLVPSNPSLYYWGEKSIDLNTSGINREHRFYGEASNTTVIPLDNFQQYRHMTYYYTPKQIEIQPCKAPLKNGELCKRKDLVVCPFHGKIIPRDDNGNPIESTNNNNNNTTNTSTDNSSPIKDYNNLSLTYKQPDSKQNAKKRKSSNLVDLNDRDSVKSKIEKVLSNLGK